MTDLPRPSRLTRMADRFGATASFLCALHCAALPALFAVLPATGLGFLLGHGFERGFVVFAALLALTTLVTGFRRHRRFQAFWFLLAGAGLLAAGVLVDGVLLDSAHAGSLHALLLASGGTLVMLAHLVNLRLSHGTAHVHDANCRHP